jgi:hypothetical protein
MADRMQEFRVRRRRIELDRQVEEPLQPVERFHEGVVLRLALPDLVVEALLEDVLRVAGKREGDLR